MAAFNQDAASLTYLSVNRFEYHLQPQRLHKGFSIILFPTDQPCLTCGGFSDYLKSQGGEDLGDPQKHCSDHKKGCVAILSNAPPIA